MPSTPTARRARYAEQRARGLCTQCDRPSTRSRCATCAATKATHRARERASPHAGRRCVRCPAEVSSGRTCEACRAVDRLASKLRRERMEAAGLRTRCGKARVRRGPRCAKCRARVARVAKARALRQKTGHALACARVMEAA